MRTLIRNVAVAGTLGAMWLGGALAQSAPTLPPVHKMGSAEYLSGGIGLDESRTIEQASKHWPLTLEFAAKDRKHDDFLSDVKVQIRDSRGHEALATTTDGPFLLAKLPPGPYVVDATLGDKTLHENVTVRQHQPAKAVFVWPAEARDSAS